MVFYIMEDLLHSTEVKIHKESCGHVRHHLRYPNVSTTEWHIANTLEEAIEKASDIARNNRLGYRQAKCCM